MFCVHGTMRPASVRAISATALIAAALTSSPAAAATALVGGDPVLYWNEVAISGLVGPFPATSRAHAMVSIAIHDAVNATTGARNRSFLNGVAASGGDTRAAASQAARNMLVHLNPGRTSDFDAALAASLALVPDGPAKAQGMATGAAFAAAMIANRSGDGSGSLVTYTPSGLPGGWAPTPPGFGPAAIPHYAGVTSFLLNSPAQFRAAPPPAVTSPQYAAAFNEVKALGSLTSLTRTPDQSAAALFWVGASGTGPWLRAGIDAAQTNNLSTVEAARLLALVSASTADAFTSVWDTKYEYDYWRPVTGIRLAGLDGNDLTEAQADWTPFVITPPFPAYTSGHAGVSSAAATILSSTFGSGYGFCLPFAGRSRCFDSFEAAALDSANSRLWGGIHWRFDNEVGNVMGRNVATYALKRNIFDAVPEPTTWAMMILGFGAVGAAARARAARAIRQPASGALR